MGDDTTPGIPSSKPKGKPTSFEDYLLLDFDEPTPDASDSPAKPEKNVVFNPSSNQDSTNYVNLNNITSESDAKFAAFLEHLDKFWPPSDDAVGLPPIPEENSVSLLFNDQNEGLISSPSSATNVRDFSGLLTNSPCHLSPGQSFNISKNSYAVSTPVCDPFFLPTDHHSSTGNEVQVHVQLICPTTDPPTQPDPAFAPLQTPEHPPDGPERHRQARVSRPLTNAERCARRRRRLAAERTEQQEKLKKLSKRNLELKAKEELLRNKIKNIQNGAHSMGLEYLFN